MSACICRLRADECTGSSGIYYPLQDGGECAVQDCEKQVTTDNSATLVNALADNERKTAALRMALDAIEGTYIGWRGEKSGEAITTIKEALS